MATKRPTQRWKRIEDILELGQETLGDTMEALYEKPLEERNRDYVHALSEAVQAAGMLAKEQREAITWLAKNKGALEQAHETIEEYVANLDPARAAEMLERLRKRAGQVS